LLKLGSESVPEEAEEPEPQPKERTMSVTVLTEGLGLAGPGIKGV